MRVQRGVGIALLGAGLVVLSCSADRGGVAGAAGADASVPTASATAVVESSAAATRIAELRARFRLPVFEPENDRPRLAAPAKPLVATTRAVLGAAVAMRFEAAPDAASYVRAVLPVDALRGVTRPAHVALPVRASDAVKLEDDTSHVSLRFVLEHVQDARIEVAGGTAIYRGALDGADVVHRVHAEGTEDFVVFETRPAREELSYSVDVSRVPGLRLVSNTLEFLDEGGTPVLRVAPPYVVDAMGARHAAKLAVAGCAYDTNPAGPWGRAVTRPGARCSVRVEWSGGVAYPAMVDPAWVATGSLITGRYRHTASVLPSGKVLVAGGYNGGYLASAELYDPAGNAGAGTFAATGSMVTAREDDTASVLPSGKVLVAGGYNGGNLASAELYDPTGNAGAGTFSATGAMATAREGHSASVLPSGRVLVAGGDNGTSTLASAEVFDPSGNSGAGTFAATGSMATARYYHTASVLPSGKVLIAGGQKGVSPFYLATAELYDPAGNAGVGTFAATGSMVASRYGHTASVLPSGKVLVVGGNSSGVVYAATAEVYDPAANAGAGSFAPTGSMVTLRALHTASALPSGRVLVGGGYNGGYLASAEVFDPAGNAGAGTFGGTVTMNNAREYHTSSVLPSGKVLVAGGYNGGGFVASAELFGGVPGEACSSGDNCVSGFCIDGFCCNSTCSGSCDRCDLVGTEGTCKVAPSGDPGANPTCAPYVCGGASAACPTFCTSDTTCAAGYFCAADATCHPRKAQAAACNIQTDCKESSGCRECMSGFCVDGVCCDTACDGACQACLAALKYSSVKDGTCDTAKNGLSRGGLVCGPPGTTCDANHTTTAPDGTKHDCSPYKCESSGGCRSTCTSVNDCVAPTICDANGECVPPTSNNDSGCSVAVQTPKGYAGLPWIVVGFGMLWVCRRSRRARGGVR